MPTYLVSQGRAIDVTADLTSADALTKRTRLLHRWTFISADTPEQAVLKAKTASRKTKIHGGKDVSKSSAAVDVYDSASLPEKCPNCNANLQNGCTPEVKSNYDFTASKEAPTIATVAEALVAAKWITERSEQWLKFGTGHGTKIRVKREELHELFALSDRLTTVLEPILQQYQLAKTEQ